MRSTYSACKAAIAGFTRTLAKEVAKQGITVNCVAPAAVNTPRWGTVLSATPELAKQYIDWIPMGRPAEPEEIAGLIVYLASDEAAYITGQEYGIDGGITL